MICNIFLRRKKSITRKAARSCSNRKAVRSRDDHIVVSAGAVDHQQTAVLGSAADDACMEIVRVAMKEAEGDGWID